MIAGFKDNTKIYPSPSIEPDELQKKLDDYLAKYDDSVKAQDVFAKTVALKNSSLFAAKYLLSF